MKISGRTTSARGSRSWAWFLLSGGLTDDADLLLIALVTTFLFVAGYLLVGAGALLVFPLVFVVIAVAQVRRHATRRGARELVAGPLSGSLDAACAATLDELNVRLARARHIPLSEEARMELGEIEPLIAEIVAASEGTGLEAQARALAQETSGPRVLGTNQVRLNQDRVRALVEELRAHCA